MKLLAIDDEPIVLRAIEAYLLAEDDIELVTALGGAEGLAAWQAHQPDLTLLDLRMPELDGMAVLRQMSILGNLERHPVIILSGHIIHAERRKCRELGARDIWDKPLDPWQFTNLLDSMRQS